YHRNSIITECPRSNLFIVTKENKLVTPAHNILKGITRKNVLQLASSIMEVEERDIKLTELLDAAEVFLTSTTKKVLPVLNVDGNAIGNARPGPVTM
ncbi:aminotransferase class IV, partial [Rhizobium leguminosarum]|uniref:aminotransferase class IV n=1 Tax=Rhizobium leguminosarum TaxID=384 RepID=UPI003F985365